MKCEDSVHFSNETCCIEVLEKVYLLQIILRRLLIPNLVITIDVRSLLARGPLAIHIVFPVTWSVSKLYFITLVLILMILIFHFKIL